MRVPVSISETVRMPRMIMMPSQKDGMAMPAIEKVRTTRSIQVFW